MARHASNLQNFHVQGGRGPAGQQDLLAKLAQAAAAHPHLQRAVPNANARTLDDIEAAVRGSGPPNSFMGTFQQQGAQGPKPGNALLSLLQANASSANAPFGQVEALGICSDCSLTDCIPHCGRPPARAVSTRIGAKWGACSDHLQ